MGEKITGTDHQIPHLYDVNTFQCYLSSNVPEIGVNGSINQAWSTQSIYLEGLIFHISQLTLRSLRKSIPCIMQVRYSSTGGMYVTASKDGAVRLWDGVTANSVRSIVGAHGAAEVTGANFTKDQRYTSWNYTQS